jgi:hypothetical protein
MKFNKRDLDAMMSDDDTKQETVERKIVKEKMDQKRVKSLARERRKDKPSASR